MSAGRSVGHWLDGQCLIGRPVDSVGHWLDGQCLIGWPVGQLAIGWMASI